MIDTDLTSLDCFRNFPDGFIREFLEMISMSARTMSKADLVGLYRQAIREHFEEQEYVTKADVKEQIRELRKNSWSMEELKTELPDDLWAVVQEHLSDPETRELVEEEIEIEDNVSKSIFDNLLPQGEVDIADVAPPAYLADPTEGVEVSQESAGILDATVYEGEDGE